MPSGGMPRAKNDRAAFCQAAKVGTKVTCSTSELAGNNRVILTEKVELRIACSWKDRDAVRLRRRPINCDKRQNFFQREPKPGQIFQTQPVPAPQPKNPF